MKYILVIGDGMADNPVAGLGGRTPLETANIPTMDYLASAGILGSVRTVPEGLPAGSDTAILSIFGCDPRVCYTGRAPLEAAASGIRLQPGDAAFRCNMTALEDADCPMEEKRIISHSAGSIEGDESVAIINALFADPEFAAAAKAAALTVNPASSFRHMAVMGGADLTGAVFTPPHDHLGEKAGEHLPRGSAVADTLRDLMLLAHKKLDKHPLNEARRAAGKLPANCIWFWAEGTAVELPNFPENNGCTGGVISAVPLCHGIAALCGLEPVSVQGATGELETNYEGKASGVLEILKKYDFAAVHLEAPDECTHNGDLPGKLQAIENLDARIIRPIVEGLRGQEFRMLVLSDHKTLTEGRNHDGDPVPFILYDSRYERKTAQRYCESCAESGPFVAEGTQLMTMLFSHE